MGRSCTLCWESTSPIDELDVANSVSAAMVTSTDALASPLQREIQPDFLGVPQLKHL